LLTANGDAFDHTEREPASGHLACVVAPLAVARARIVRIRTGNGLQHEAAVLRGERERPQLVERPAERHRAVPADAAVTRPETADAAVARRRENRAPRPGADGERYKTRRNSRARAARRTAAPCLPPPRLDVR